MTHLLRHIVSLEKAVGAFAPKGLFAPLGFSLSGNVSQAWLDVEALQHLARKMACFINLPFFNIVVAPAKQKEFVAGHIEGHGPGSQNVLIEIEPDFLRYPVAAIKVLAHEISHKYLAFHRLELDSTAANEILTDVAAIYLGFGTFALNGGTYTETYRKDAQTTVERTVKNGYIDLDESAFVYDIVCRMRGIGETEIFAGLNNEATKSVLRVRRRYADSYPPDNLDLSPLKGWITDVRGKLESADLELCNIDKIKMLFPGALATKKSEIESVRNDVVKTRCELEQVEQELGASPSRVAYPGIPVWTEDVNRFADRAMVHLGVSKELNAFVSTRVPPDVTRATWDAQASIVIECPRCGCRMRLPTGKAHIGVTCPKCTYAFDYSTTCPEFTWASPPRFKGASKKRVKDLFAGIRQSCARIWGQLKEEYQTVLLVALGLSLIFLLGRALLSPRASRMPPQKKEATAVRGGTAERIAAEMAERALKEAKEQADARLQKLPYPESGKVRILDKDKFWGKLRGEGGGISSFKVTTPEGHYYLIKLVEADSKTPIMDIFCHPGQATEVIVPCGDYEARMAFGENWYGYDYRFGAFTVYQKMDTVLHFTQDTGHHVTLKQVFRGNLRTEEIKEDEF